MTYLRKSLGNPQIVKVYESLIQAVNDTAPAFGPVIYTATLERAGTIQVKTVPMRFMESDDEKVKNKPAHVRDPSPSDSAGMKDDEGHSW